MAKTNSPVPVLGREDAQTFPPASSGIPTEPKSDLKVVRFVKTTGPGEAIPLKGGKEITFHHPRNNVTHRWSSASYLDTSDPVLIAEIREVAKSQPSYYIYEVELKH